MLQQRLMLSLEERREKSKLLLRDGAALCALAGLAVVLSFVTWGLFHSFSAHRRMLEQRWQHRGEAALAAGRPVLAMDDLHSALAYAPDDRGVEIELATALAEAGRLQEAQVYFTTLLEAAPGDGSINLQMARLAIRQGNAQGAVDHYQAAIDGTWNGDAFARRREIRLELARFLIAQGHFAEARNLLLITSGNGPDNYPLQLLLGFMLEQAGDPEDALDVYRKAVNRRATRLEALEGEAHAAETLGRFAEAKGELSAAMGEDDFTQQPEQVRTQTRAELDTANTVLALNPALNLPTAERDRRIARAAQLAQARLAGCLAPAPEAAASAPDKTAAPSRAGLLANGLAARLEHLNPLTPKNAVPAAAPAQASSADPLGALRLQWAPLATGPALLKQLTADPAFAQNTLQLAYDTERAAAVSCGAPAGDDLLLLRIAQAPDQVEARP